MLTHNKIMTVPKGIVSKQRAHIPDRWIRQTKTEERYQALSTSEFLFGRYTMNPQGVSGRNIGEDRSGTMHRKVYIKAVERVSCGVDGA